MKDSIFRAYDIRGIYPEELNDQDAFEIGAAFVEFIKAKNIAIGRDMRLSSPALFEAFAKGVRSRGVNVFNLGQIATECLYFAVQKMKYDGGAMVTASHNPKGYNGFKMIKRGETKPEMIRGETLRSLIGKNIFVSDFPQGNILKKDIWRDYLEHIFSFVDISKIKKFKVVVDAGNGMAGKVIPMLAPNLPIEIIPLNFDLDGNFPAHPSNPLAENAADQIKKEVLKQSADFGFIFDGDADRIFMVDEKGVFVPADITLLLLAKYLLNKNPGGGIAYNLICSKAVPELIEKWQGKPIRSKVGFINVMEGLAKNDGIMGGELSGHYCYRDNFYSDSGFISLLILLQEISKDGRKVSEIIKELNPYFKSAEVNLRIEDKKKAIDKVKEKYKDAKQDYLDGVTLEYENWWANIRPSNTEPLLRITVEADTKELLEEKRGELVDFIKTL